MKASWKIIPALVAIFLAGGVVGFVVAIKIEKTGERRLERPELLTAMMLGRMKGQLDLTEEQVAEIEPRMRTSAEALARIRRRATAESWREVVAFYSEIEEFLTEEQKREVAEARSKVRERLEGADEVRQRLRDRLEGTVRGEDEVEEKQEGR